MTQDQILRDRKKLKELSGIREHLGRILLILFVIVIQLTIIVWHIQ
jgi:hypothetical protein